MPVTQTDIDAILSAIKNGEEEVRFANGGSVRYRSIPHMREALAVLREEMAAQNAATDYSGRGSTVLASFSRD